MKRTEAREKSCGAVVFTRTAAGVRYLLVRSMAGVWGFPKGHAEGGESASETAAREIREETGLSVHWIEGFCTTDTYPIRQAGLPDAQKEVVYFLAEYREQTYRAQESEILQIGLFDYDAALAALTFESARRVLREADTFIKKRGDECAATFRKRIQRKERRKCTS